MNKTVALMTLSMAMLGLFVTTPLGMAPAFATVDTAITSAIDGKGANLANGGGSLSTSITFTFAGTKTTSSFQCSLDGAAFTTCATGSSGSKSYSGLAIGSHNFQVRAVDASGNVDSTPASFSWNVVNAILHISVGGTPPRNGFNLVAISKSCFDAAGSISSAMSTCYKYNINNAVSDLQGNADLYLVVPSAGVEIKVIGSRASDNTGAIVKSTPLVMPGDEMTLNASQTKSI